MFSLAGHGTDANEEPMSADSAASVVHEGLLQCDSLCVTASSLSMGVCQMSAARGFYF